ncbi:transposase [Nostoc sp. ChiSLP03a]|uniref:transposase n=1 Tax=Nostoc sp. ChiSLP03a TaxID=3075380 RepID=UPI002AD28913|nr:transposase [Nostoc sp. ChiSLP03a]MDZ8212117.1 transposase [Nostoc sp. ChiSLP03a]
MNNTYTILKGFKSLLVNQFYNKPVFWTAAYFVASCGGVTLEELKSYVEKHSSPDN